MTVMFNRTEKDPVFGWESIQPTRKMTPEKADRFRREANTWAVRDQIIDYRETVTAGDDESTVDVMYRLSNACDALAVAARSVFDGREDFAAVAFKNAVQQIVLALEIYKESKGVPAYQLSVILSKVEALQNE